MNSAALIGNAPPPNGGGPGRGGGGGSDGNGGSPPPNGGPPADGYRPQSGSYITTFTLSIWCDDDADLHTVWSDMTALTVNATALVR